MADNIAVTPGSGAVVAAEACSGTANALVQRIKLVLGATDTDGGNVSSANPLPVLSGTAGNFLVSAVGTVTAVSGTAANLLASVTGTVGVNTVVVVSSGTAANFLVTASGTVTAVSGTAANMLVSASGTVTAVSGTAANLLAKVSGGLTNNNAAPAATQIGVLSALANAAAQTWTEGDQVLLSTDLAGNVRSLVSGTVTAISGTAANLLVQASGTITATGTVTAVSGTAGNFLASVSGTVTATGTVTVVSGTAANLLSQVQGGKTNNNAAPGATNVGALVAIANAAAVTYTEGDQVLLSTDLSGNVRVTGSLSVGGTTDEGSFTEGSSTGTPAMGYYKSSTASIGTGQAGVVAIDKWRHLQTVVVDAAGNSRGANVSSGNAMLVDASATVQPVLSGTAANFLVSASGTVTAVSGTAANLLVTALVSCGTASTLLSQVSQGTASNLLCTAQSGTAANLLAQVSQGTASNLLTLTTLTAGTNNIGQVISGQQMSIYNGTASLAINYTSVNFTASAGNTIVAGVANKNIYILSGLLIVQNATNIQWFSGTTAGTALSGVMAMTANMGYQIPFVPIGNFATLATNAAITLSSSVATTVGGWITYVAF